MTVLNFKTTPEDAALIEKIVDRAQGIFVRQSVPFDRLSVEMDVTAAHMNGCPLRLADFLGANDAEFTHDLVGLLNSIDRSTGKLPEWFRPRSAA